MKSLAFLVFLFLAVPGSGQLAWDGIPFSTRIEFATLVLFILAIFNRSVRDWVRLRLDRLSWRGAVKPALALLVLLKLLTFTWYPFSDGFDACYRSLYRPLANAIACEKSYEGPFLRRSDLGDSNTSRTDRTVDFGVHMYDWSLPFMNEYPRLGALWLYRFPFTAKYGALVRSDSREDQFLPIYGNGEIAATLGGERLDLSTIHMFDRYMFERLSFMSVPRGAAEFTLNYRFAEDDLSEPPDVAPPIRGPYAVLKVGVPQNRASLLQFTNLRLRGHALDLDRRATPDHVVAISDSGVELGRSLPQPRPDVAQFFGAPELTESGFDFTVPANAVREGPILVRAAYGESLSTIATLSAPAQLIPELPNIQLSVSSSQRAGVAVWFDADRNDFTAFAPAGRTQMGVGFTALSWLLDITSALLVLGILIGLVVVLRKSLLIAIALGAASFGAVSLSSDIAPAVLGTTLFLPLVALSLLVLFSVRQFSSLALPTFLPMSVVLAAYRSFDHLQRFHGSKGERWWGRLLYYWRDSDWYATQGYARTVFLEGSLRGGEALFWFQAGPRYLALATRVLLGENDVLVGIIMTSLGFLAVFVLFTRSQSVLRSLSHQMVAGAALFVMLLFMSDDLMAGFGFVGSSEYPTWTALLLITGFVIATRTESRTWLMVAMAIALGYSIQLRPNQIGGIVLVFVALLLLVDRREPARAIATVGKMTVAFIALVLFSLLHNLYYGESFVPFTGNAGINYQFSWLDVLGINDGDATWAAVWAQLRVMMYWNAVGNYSWALMFWGSQLLWVWVVAYRLRAGLARRARSLLLLIPFGYAIPMLKYQMGSYYPRHLVVINLSFMCAALMAWPREDEVTSSGVGDGGVSGKTEEHDASAPVNAVVA